MVVGFDIAPVELPLPPVPPEPTSAMYSPLGTMLKVSCTICPPPPPPAEPRPAPHPPPPPAPPTTKYTIGLIHVAGAIHVVCPTVVNTAYCTVIVGCGIIGTSGTGTAIAVNTTVSRGCTATWLDDDLSAFPPLRDIVTAPLFTAAAAAVLKFVVVLIFKVCVIQLLLLFVFDIYSITYKYTWHLTVRDCCRPPQKIEAGDC